MSCPDPLQVQAYFDGELERHAAAGLERHVEDCPECRALLHSLEETRRAIRRDFTTEGAPPAFRARLIRTLAAEYGSPTPARARATPWRLRTFWAGALTGAGGALAAAALAALLWAGLAGRSLVDSLVTQHVDSLLPGHLISVESTDRHTVKPWFAGRADVSPLVEDFAGEGFVLVGGRVDHLANQRAAVLVYRHGQHIINVFSWKRDAGGRLRDTTRNGYHLAFFTAGDLEYCAVSDTSWQELRRLERLFSELGARETPP